MCSFDWCRNQRPWMTLKAITHPVSKYTRFRGFRHENLRKDRPILLAAKNDVAQ